MAHSETTSEKYYQFPSIAKAVQMHSCIQEISRQKHFTHEQDWAMIKEQPVETQTTATTRLCELIAAKHNIDKTWQQLQDHWKP